MVRVKTHHIVAYVLAAILALVLGMWAASLRDHGGRDTAELALQGGTALGHLHRKIPEFELVDGNGKPFSRDRLLGRWSLLFFGYTHCPDICPMTMAILGQAVREIDRQPGSGSTAPYQVVFVSVDPERDEPNQLRDYVSYFDPSFIGVTGEPDAIDSLTNQLGILHAKVSDPNNTDNYLVDHSASILVVNPAGELAAILSAPHSPQVIARDFRALADHYDRG